MDADDAELELPLRRTRPGPFRALYAAALVVFVAFAFLTALFISSENRGKAVVSVELGGGSNGWVKRAHPLGLPDDPVQPVVLADVSPEKAQEINASVPFVNAQIVKASAFASKLEGIDRDRARACLAVAGIYEAGGDANDQRPVMQVVLNRVRHPAFPNSVCEVVFQGSELQTGCQFSFACDGSMKRFTPRPRTLSRAMELAEWMLSDGVDERVGHATHYHTDWVVPYWSAKLDKLTKINTHIFFRWPGSWGQKQAFRAVLSPKESRIPQLASYSTAHSQEAEAIALDEQKWAELNALDADVLEGTERGYLATQTNRPPPQKTFVIPTKKLIFSNGMTAGRWSLDAAGACGDLPACRVVGWSDPSRVPAVLNPDTLAQSPPDLVFVQELRNRIQTAYWDCSKWERAGTSRCLGSSSERLALVAGAAVN